METPEELRARLDDIPYEGDNLAFLDVEIEKAVQLSRIATALESIEETGVYTWPQEQYKETPRRRE